MIEWTHNELISKVVRTLQLMPHPSEFVPTRPTPDCVRWLSTPPTVTFEMTSINVMVQGKYLASKAVAKAWKRIERPGDHVDTGPSTSLTWNS